MAGVPSIDTIAPYTCTSRCSIHSVVERAIFHYGNIVINRLDTIRPITSASRGVFWPFLLCLLPSWFYLLYVGLGLFQFNCLLFVAWPLYLYPNPLDLVFLKLLNPCFLWASRLESLQLSFLLTFVASARSFSCLDESELSPNRDSVKGTVLGQKCLHYIPH